MSNGRKWTGLCLVAGAAAVVGFASPAATQAQDDVPAVNTGAISLELGADVVTEYWFRGIGQENQGFIFQPYAEINVDLGEVGGLEPTFYAGTWNSFHDRGDRWFEADFYAGLVAEVADGLTLDVGYINYRAPDSATTLAQEIAVGVAYDDEELMEGYGLFGLNPRALLAFEFQGAASGPDEGIYLELGIAPEFAVVPEGDFPVTLSIPVTAGFSLDDYYQDASGDDSTFGFVDVGVVAGVPLRFMPREYGDWSASAGVHGLWLGDTNQDISEMAGTGDDSFNIYGTVGISMTY
ncbi:MAG: TorF family putative porin [Phycisphaeraceae bacterium]